MILPNPKPETYRSEKYKQFIRKQPCIVCGHLITHHHHESDLKNFGGGMGKKCHDYISLPLCDMCHRFRENNGFESFWKDTSVFRKIIEYILKYIDENGYDSRRIMADVLMAWLHEKKL